jgi:hypothetical protein
VNTEELLIALLTGGGLALLGTVLGVFITQIFALRLGREQRREARLVEVRTFQRDTLVALQDEIVDAENLFEQASNLRKTEDFAVAWSDYEKVARRVSMHGTRVRDEYLRAAVKTWLEARNEWHGAIVSQGPITAATIRKTQYSVLAVHERAGELIRTLDAIDEAEDQSAPQDGKGRSEDYSDD